MSECTENSIFYARENANCLQSVRSVQLSSKDLETRCGRCSCLLLFCRICLPSCVLSEGSSDPAPGLAPSFVIILSALKRR